MFCYLKVIIIHASSHSIEKQLWSVWLNLRWVGLKVGLPPGARRLGNIWYELGGVTEIRLGEKRPSGVPSSFDLTVEKKHTVLKQRKTVLKCTPWWKLLVYNVSTVGLFFEMLPSLWPLLAVALIQNRNNGSRGGVGAETLPANYRGRGARGGENRVGKCRTYGK